MISRGERKKNTLHKKTSNYESKQIDKYVEYSEKEFPLRSPRVFTSR